MDEKAKKKRCCVFAFNIIVFFLAIGALITLCVLLAEYFLVYEVWFKANDGSCVTSYSTYRPENGKCSVSCGKNCQRSHEYPCLLIYAKFYETKGSNATPVSNSSLSQVYKNEKAYDRRKSHCSYLPECREYSEALPEVAEYQAKFGKPGTQYECLQKRDEAESVIQELTGNRTMFIHFFTWPSVIFVLCVIYFIIIRLKFPHESIWFVLGTEWICCPGCPCNKKTQTQIDAENNAKMNAMQANTVAGNGHHGNNAYGNNAYGNNAYGNNAYGNNAYGNNAYGNNAYGNNAYGNNYGNAYGNQGNSNPGFNYDSQLYQPQA